jgi:hypothetical protein
LLSVTVAMAPARSRRTDSTPQILAAYGAAGTRYR